MPNGEVLLYNEQPVNGVVSQQMDNMLDVRNETDAVLMVGIKVDWMA